MKRLDKKRKLIIAGAAAVALYALIGFVIIPFASKIIVPKKLNEALQREVLIEKISFNPFAFSLKIKNFKIYTKDKKNTFAGFEEFYTNINLTSSIFTLSPVIEKAYLKSPEFYIEQKEKNLFNFSDLIPKENNEEVQNNSEQEKNKEENKKFEFLVKDLDIEKGDIVFEDNLFDTRHKMSDLNISIPLISGFEKDKDVKTEIDASALINNSSTDLNLSSALFSDNPEYNALLNIKKISIPFYYNYIKNYIDFVPESAFTDLDIKASYQENRNKPLELDGNASIYDFLITKEGTGDLVSFKKFFLKLDKSYPLSDIYNIKKVLLDSPDINIQRKDNIINILNLYKKEEKNKSSDLQVNEKDDLQSENKMPEINIEKFEIKNGAVSFTDYDSPLHISGFFDHPAFNKVSDLDITAKSFTTKTDSSTDLKISGDLNNKTNIDISGNFSVNPLTADLKTDINKLYFEYANHYIPSGYKLLIKNGYINLNSNTSFSYVNEKTDLTFLSDIVIADTDIVRRDTNDKFFKMEKSEIKKLKFTLNPSGLDIDTVLISGINQDIVKNKNGNLNLTEVFPENEDSSKAEPEKSEKNDKDSGSFPVKISKIELRNIGADFTDYTMSPYFSAQVDINSADIKGISSQNFQSADLDLKGRINNSALINADGKINPFPKDLFVDLNINLNDLNLTSATPYSGRFLGRAIQKGQLSLDLNYDIKENKIIAKNSLFLDQFEFGRKIKSPDALNLPLGLAVGLLKDRKGEINLHIPVSGDFNDPDFELGGAVFQVLKSILVKAATSPFSFAASLVGGGEDMKYIVFEKGKNKISGSETEKIRAIEELLYSRPALNLNITGFADIKKDRKALKEIRFENLVSSYKAEQGFKENEEIDEKKYIKILKKIYSQFSSEPLKEEENQDLKSLYEDQIKVFIEISDEELRFLASKRAEKVKQLILAMDRIESSRLFIYDTNAIMPDEKKNVSASRAELNLE
ncbi:MAG: DUF748 domain-containing protein [Thermodesulfobacteriota bacterium]